MAAVLRLPTEDFLSDKYMETFYRAHVASRARGNLDEDIAAIEAEIRKVKSYQSRFRQCQHQLNSCGNSECSDEDDLDTSSEASTVSTSVFKVSNCSAESYRSVSPSASVYSGREGVFVFPRGPDVFTWAVTQQISHDHGYCKSGTLPSTAVIERGTVTMRSVPWHTLNDSQRAQAILKLSCILQHRPSDRQSPTFSSFDLLPTSLANSIRKTGSLGFTHTSSGLKAAKAHEPLKKQSLPHTNNITIKEIKSHERIHQKQPVTPSVDHKQQQLKSTPGPVRTRRQRTNRPSPYTTRKSEVTRMRKVSSCSEGDDPVVID